MIDELFGSQQRWDDEIKLPLGMTEKSIKDQLHAKYGSSITEEKLREVLPKLIAENFGSSGVLRTPPILLEVIAKLVEGKKASVICDPWAGLGFVLAIVAKTTQAEKKIAVTPTPSYANLGKTFFQDMEWKVGEPISVLNSLPIKFDVVVSLPPLGMKYNETGQSNNEKITLVEIKGISEQLTFVHKNGDDLGHSILASASSRLKDDGLGIFLVTSGFFTSSHSVIQKLNSFGLGVEAAFGLPSGLFSPVTNIATYLVVIRKRVIDRMFVAQLSKDSKTNLQIVSNFKEKKEAELIELGKYVNTADFISIDSLRIADRIEKAMHKKEVPAVRLGELASLVTLGQHKEGFRFPDADNCIFVPLIGISDVVDSEDDMTLKNQNYAQVIINSRKSLAGFVTRFLNTDFGKDIRESCKSGSFIPKINKQTLNDLWILVPDIQTQKEILEIETRISAEENTILSLKNELLQFRREIWSNLRPTNEVNRKLSVLSGRISGGLKQHAESSLDKWFETLPFPLATILRAWQATSSQDYKKKYEHLLDFFEAVASFTSVILLSAFESNESLFTPYKQTIIESLQRNNQSYERPTFGMWKSIVEYLGKSTRDLLNNKGKNQGDSGNGKEICSELFSGQIILAETLSRIEVVDVLTMANKMRNEWRGHSGIVGEEDAKYRNEQLLNLVQKLREVFGDLWGVNQVIRSLGGRPRQGVFENEIAILMGSHSEFLRETRTMSTWLDVERIYITNNESSNALKLLPLVQIGPSPQSARNACYFYNRVDGKNVRFVSYHYEDKPELNEQFAETFKAIKLLSTV